MPDTAPRHTEPCGCVYRMIDVPDDLAIGQGWEIIAVCKDHVEVERRAREIRAAWA